LAKGTLKVGNAQAFWGDRPDAAAELLRQQPDLDYLTLDYLAEVSMSILAIQKEKDPSLGYAQDFIDVIDSLAPIWKEGSKCKVICNAGGLNPNLCAERCMEVLQKAGCEDKVIGIVRGDDVVSQLKNAPDSSQFKNSETGQDFKEIQDRLVTANAYLGAEAIVRALQAGADIVITGRVADPSLTVAACVHHFNWPLSDYDKLAAATVAGHLIECGTQVTGGISTDWLTVPDPADMGYPVVEMSEDGTFVVTKPENTGGRVSIQTVKEQLLYEIGDPDQYLSPDATVSFLHLEVKQTGPDRVQVTGAVGTAPPPLLKVSATYRDGYKAEAMLTVLGRDAVRKAKRCGDMLVTRVRDAGLPLARTRVECLGACSSVMGVLPPPPVLLECVLRVAVADADRAGPERFTREVAGLVTSGAPGITGYATGRPKVRPIFGFWPCQIHRAYAGAAVDLIKLGEE